MQWPDFFPNECPPNSATSAQGTFYRLVYRNTLSERDFHPLKFKKPNEDFGEKACQSSGLSMFQDIDEVRRLRRRARGMEKRRIARGDLAPHLGKILSTPGVEGRTHYTWWLPVGIIAECLSCFTVVDESS